MSRGSIPTRLLLLIAGAWAWSALALTRLALRFLSWLDSAVFDLCLPWVELFDCRVPLRLDSFEWLEAICLERLCSLLL